jgi:hypothetical protein
MKCDEGFSVYSKDKQEVAEHGMMHVEVMHPGMKITKEDMEKKVKMN